MGGVNKDSDFPAQYPDNGCIYAPKCLECHLPICAYDMTVAERRVEQRRALARRRMGYKQDTGLTDPDVAMHFGVSAKAIGNDRRILELTDGRYRHG